MKFFKKKRFKLPKPGAIRRLVAKTMGARFAQRYDREMALGGEFPERIREATLVRLHPKDRGTVEYYPDIKNFQIVLDPNRKLPVDKFLNLFKGMIDQEVLDRALHDMTNYRLEIYTTLDKWVEVYNDDNVRSCMSGPTNAHLISCYVHPENNLAIAALYAPGGSRVIARSIVNTEEKWYIRNFGDALLVKKLNELGYNKIGRMRGPIKMYGFSSTREHYEGQVWAYPFFDFPDNGRTHTPDSYNPLTQKFEVTIL